MQVFGYLKSDFFACHPALKGLLKLDYSEKPVEATDQETRRPGDQETRRPGDQETRRPGDQEYKKVRF